ncbi:hypothetical protein HELRODRAFT_162309 [Helobdella robusta]|uniref:RING-type domain-containing protein n=1 Tax=Helobdella robusta TaxID=6412 RepID=T1ESH8_HELRO|nr:hypothetical protein HELRODRAFT_162309 [Helobdella robusta]ESN98849.1 hypothetical protein HELRODRAFT_162309 [Helobdella robusta]
MNTSTEKSLFRSEVSHAVEMYFIEFIDRVFGYARNAYVEFLQKHFADYNISANDIRDFANFLAEDVVDLAGVVVLGKNHKKKKWTEQFRSISIELLYKNLKEMQISYFSTLPRENMFYRSCYQETYFGGDIHHTDTCFKEGAHTDVLIVPFVEKFSLNTSCPVCFEDYDEGKFIYEMSCGHSIDCGCAEDWFVEKSVCPYCSRKVKAVVETSRQAHVSWDENDEITVDIYLTTKPYDRKKIDYGMDAG